MHRQSLSVLLVSLLVVRRTPALLLPERQNYFFVGDGHKSCGRRGRLSCRSRHSHFMSAGVGEDNVFCIKFSRNFQRHVVYRPKWGRSADNSKPCRFDGECREVVESFRFLDEALEKYPHAKLTKRPEIANLDDAEDCNQVIAGMGDVPSSSYARIIANSDNESIGCISENSTVTCMDYLEQGKESLEYLSLFTASLARSQTDEEDDLKRIEATIESMLLDRVGIKRFRSHTPQSILLNYNRLADLLTRSRPKKIFGGDDSMEEVKSMVGPGLAFAEAGVRTLISYFPELCLYDYREVEERVQFLMAPKPTEISPFSRGGARISSNDDIDWPLLFWKGYGAGMSVEQATEAVRAVPNILATHYTDSRKPDISYFIQGLQVSYELNLMADEQLYNHLKGADPSDVWTFAYLNQIGVGWTQLEIMLDAFPTLTCFPSNTDWELNARGVKSDFINEPALIYLRKRLQAGTKTVSALLKTHSRLNSYGEKHIMDRFNAFQCRIGLSSRELQKVVLRMPSLLGMSILNGENQSVSALDKRLNFFLDEVGMTQEDIKTSLIKQPSLLQYSVENNMRPKLSFFVQELHLSLPVVSRIISMAPGVMGLSLEDNIRPKVGAIRKGCNLSETEVGVLVATVPSILLLSTKRKIVPCFDFLFEALELPDQDSLGMIITGAPRILVQGIESSLAPKIRALDYAIVLKQKEGVLLDSLVSDVCIKNPALLATTNAILSKRIDSCFGSDPKMTLEDALAPSSRGRKQKFGIIGGEVVSLDGAMEDSVVAAGKRRAAPSTTSPLGGPAKDEHVNDVNTILITCFASGQVFSRDGEERVRGTDRFGGMAVKFVQKVSARQLRLAADLSWGDIIPEADGGSDFKDGLVLARFTPLRPSRNRCDLCSCELSLKIILNLLKATAKSTDLSTFHLRIEVCTDSTYVWKMVHDRDLLLRWGSYPSADKFVYDGPGPKALANVDILYPLSEAFAKLSSGRPEGSSVDAERIGKSVDVVFKHTSEVYKGATSELATKQMKLYGQRAALWSYNRSKAKLGGPTPENPSF